MRDKDRQLFAACQQAQQTAYGFIGWSERHPDVAHQAGNLLRREFNRHALGMERLSRAAQRPMAVAVFGPSQSGKSYLISALARKGTDPLIARFNERQIDFVQDINPQGGKESTGIVTRFTIRPQEAVPPEFPVSMVLLDQLDVVKILGNTFLADIDPVAIPDIGPGEVEEALGRATKAAQAVAVDHLSEMRIYDLKDYFRRYFSGVQRIKELDDYFWDQAAALIPRLRIDDRAELLSLLWAATPQFTRLYKRLYRSLELLNFSETAYAGIDALLPRETSIIDVSTLAGLGGPPGNQLRICDASGHQVELPRCDVTALIAELVIEMRDQPYDYFQHTDLLDFPGYRSRDLIRHPEDFLEKEDSLNSLFLRGKVAYLFQRYREERELTSMLLCIGDSNQEVKSLPEVIAEWISDTHGPTPEERTGKPVTLFLVLTKFDKEFDEKEGEGQESADFRNKWSNRFHSSLWDFLGKQHTWHLQWDNSGPFRNTFWLRNPNFKAKHLFVYDEKGREVKQITAEREVKRIGQLKQGFLENEKVIAHFRDPLLAWDAAFELNDGGVGYLARQLGQVCDPDLKYNQISNRFRQLAGDMAACMEEYFVSDDKTARMDSRIAQSKVIVKALIRCADAQRFGQLLRKIQVSEETLSRMYYRIDREILPETSVTLADEKKSEESSWTSLLGLESDEAKEQEAGLDVKTFAERYADDLLEIWIANLHELIASQKVQHYFFLPQEILTDLIHELKSGAQRLQLRERIIEVVNEARRIKLNIHQIVSLPVRRSGSIINDYINYLGFQECAPALRPRVNDVPIFTPRQPVEGSPILEEEAGTVEMQYVAGWLRGFLQLVEDNARTDAGTVINVAANDELRSLLATLADSTTKTT